MSPVNALIVGLIFLVAGGIPFAVLLYLIIKDGLHQIFQDLEKEKNKNE